MKIRTGFAVVILCVGLTVAAVAEPPRPPVFMPEQNVEAFIQAASEMSRYPVPKSRPIVMLVPAATMAGLYGRFNYATPEVLQISDATPQDMLATVVLHEMVHYLQYHAGVLPDRMPTCAERAAFEAEAYVAAFRFELKYLKTTHGLDVTLSNCEARGIPNDTK